MNIIDNRIDVDFLSKYIIVFIGDSVSNKGGV